MSPLLADLIGNDRPFAFIYFDCCYMSGIEVAYELRNATDYIIASATELPSDGMRYDLNLPLLFKQQPDVVGAAQTTFEQYDMLSDGDRTCTMSVIRCDALDGLAESTHDIYSSVTPHHLGSGNPDIQDHKPLLLLRSGTIHRGSVARDRTARQVEKRVGQRRDLQSQHTDAVGILAHKPALRSVDLSAYRSAIGIDQRI